MDSFDEVASSQEVTKYTVVGTSTSGGFSDTPFGSAQDQKYWTVKGSSPEKVDYFECGTSHRSKSPSPDESPSMVSTHHSIWFRGLAPDDKQARDRLLAFASQNIAN